VNATTGKIASMVTPPGQVTSAVPFDGGIAAVRGAAVVSIAGSGRTQAAARTYRAAP
jgi:hypothetical protein